MNVVTIMYHILTELLKINIILPLKNIDDAKVFRKFADIVNKYQKSTKVQLKYATKEGLLQ